MMNENESGDTEPGRANQQIADLELDLIRVLHVEDDPNCREAIADQLSDHGFVVRSFADAFSLADGLAVSSEADIILLDWDLPDNIGHRSARRAAPVRCGPAGGVSYGLWLHGSGEPRVRGGGRRFRRQGSGR